MVAALFLFNTYTDPPVDPAWERAASAGPPGSVTVRFTGTSTLLFSDGETHWMIDGWFSRPSPLRLVLGKIEPDLDAIEFGLASNEVEELDAVFVVHSHYDHAMDAPEVARRTGATLLGSEATANIARGWGLDESQIRVLRDRQPQHFGRFLLTPIITQHFQFPDPRMRARALEDPEINEPLVPPVSAFDYRLGIPYALYVEHPRGSFLIQASAGYEVGGFDDLEADTVFLGIGGIGSQTDAYREAYWLETVETVGAKRVIPIHWDGLTGPIEGPFRGPVRILAFLSSGTDETLAFLRDKQASNPELEFWTLPRYGEVVLFP